MYDFTIVFVTILSPLLPVLVYDYDQQLSFADQTTMGNSQFSNNHAIGSNSNSITPKVVFLNFYDDEKDQFTNAKPILDKYGFKGTFFIVCNWANTNSSRMTWNDINQLYREGHDIESHSTSHKVLDDYLVAL
jgi:peptidoglycan/xylan/chitin deacetylase (PgdA/CDA1 family)